jgi:hypothetical protein
VNIRRWILLVAVAALAASASGCSSAPDTVEEFETERLEKVRSEALTRMAGFVPESMDGSAVVTDETADECQLARANQQGFDDVYEQYRCVVTRQVTFGSEQAGWLAGAELSDVAEELLRLNDLPLPSSTPAAPGALTAEVVIRPREDPLFLGLLETPYHDQDGSKILSSKRTVDSKFIEPVCR